MKVLAERPDFAYFLRRAQQEVFIVAIESDQSANDVAGVSPHTELIHPANVDGDAHRVILNTERISRQSAANHAMPRVETTAVCVKITHRRDRIVTKAETDVFKWPNLGGGMRQRLEIVK